MVLINFNDKQKELIGLLNKFEIEILNEFLRITIEFIKKEINNKMLNSAAQKLGIPPTDLKEAIEFLIWIFVESCKLNLNEKEFIDSLILVGFKQEVVDEFKRTFLDNKEFVSEYLNSLKLNLTSYKNIEWRIDVKLATRSIRNLVEPEIMLKLDLETKEAQKSHLLQTDPVNLRNLTETLEEALNEIRSNYCRRVMRNIV